MAKYSIVKGKSGKAKKVIVAGVKKVLYKKKGSMSMYVISKKRHIKLSKYKKMKMKGGEGQTGGKKRKKRKTGGGFLDIFSFLKKNSEQEQQQQQGGRKKKRGKKRISKK
jgi:hypothetical protein